MRTPRDSPMRCPLLIASAISASMPAFMCTIESCHKTFPRESNLKRHIETVHAISVRKVVCNGCKKAMKDTNSLTRHQGRCPGKSPAEALEVLAPIGTIFNCPYCDHQAAGFTSFEGHILQVNLLDFRLTEFISVVQQHPESPIDVEPLTFENQAQFDCWRDDSMLQ